MKKILFLLFVYVSVLMFASCSKPFGPAGPDASSAATATPETYYNNGRIQSSTLTTYMGITITASETFYYDATGKIRRKDGVVFGFPAGSTSYSYTSSGKLSKESPPAGSSSEIVNYTYDGSGHIATRACVDSTSLTTTTNLMTFTTDAAGLITRIDELKFGNPASYRIMTRDAGGFLTREDIYAPGAVTPSGYVNYIRDSVLKKTTMQVYFATTLMCEISINYDSSGFYLSKSITFGMGAMGLMNLDQTNILQSGLFDSGGMTGYYFTDKDIFGITWMQFTASGAMY